MQTNRVYTSRFVLIYRRGMDIPVIDLKALDGDNSTEMMAQLHDACEKWGFFWVCRKKTFAINFIPIFFISASSCFVRDFNI
jgi:isopenicillin N synthase-like dioxygenase